MARIGRDEFPWSVRRALALRVAHRCSRPECRSTTTGPQANGEGTLNIGVAAHITAAAPGGPRYDAGVTAAERSAVRNGIWLCQNCAKLVDNDPQRFTAGILRQWKGIAETYARDQIGLTVGRGKPRHVPDSKNQPTAPSPDGSECAKSERPDLFLDAFSPDYRRYFGLFVPRERVNEPLQGEPRAHYEWLTDVLYTGILIAKSAVFVPHAFVLQCPLLSRLVEHNRLLVRESLLRMPMGDGDVGESLEKMRRTYPRQEFPRIFTADAETIVAVISEAVIPRSSKLGNGIVRIVEELPDTRANGQSRWNTISTDDIRAIVHNVQTTFDRGAPITYEAVRETAPTMSAAARSLIFASIHYAFGVQHVREYGLGLLADIPGTRVTAIIVMFGHRSPTGVALTQDIRLGSFPLRLQTIERLIQTFFR